MIYMSLYILNTLSAGYNNYEKPYFCTKTELQLHFRGKHTKEYLEMVSAVTGKPAGKEVQLGRHNHLKANLNIKGSVMLYFSISFKHCIFTYHLIYYFSVTKNDSNTNINNRSYSYKPLQQTQ